MDSYALQAEQQQVKTPGSLSEKAPLAEQMQAG